MRDFLKNLAHEALSLLGLAAFLSTLLLWAEILPYVHFR